MNRVSVPYCINTLIKWGSDPLLMLGETTTMFQTYDEALHWIHSRLRTGIKPGLKANGMDARKIRPS